MLDMTDGIPWPLSAAEREANEQARYHAHNQFWSISKRMGSLSCNDFKKLTKAFQAATAEAYGTSVTLDIKAMDTSPARSAIGSPERDDHNRWTQEKAFLKTNDLNDLTNKDWAKAAWINVTLRPADESKVPGDTQAEINYTSRSDAASFYISTEKTNVRSIKPAVVAAKSRWSKVMQG